MKVSFLALAAAGVLMVSAPAFAQVGSAAGTGPSSMGTTNPSVAAPGAVGTTPSTANGTMGTAPSNEDRVSDDARDMAEDTAPDMTTRGEAQVGVGTSVATPQTRVDAGANASARTATTAPAENASARTAANAAAGASLTTDQLNQRESARLRALGRG